MAKWKRKAENLETTIKARDRKVSQILREQREVQEELNRDFNTFL